MSEELIQRNLVEAPEKMGDWNFYNIGATTLKALKGAKIIPDRDYEEFEGKKADCLHWMHILDVFYRLKNETKTNPMEDIEKAFGGYLSLLTGGNISAVSMDEKLKTEITSGKHPLTEEILSEGTRDTIALAFRLSVLEHLYPSGGCVAVFDDPFTDMDPTRTGVACRLLQRFAEKNQVIFVTCDEKYRSLLQGNCIAVK